jgi:hypothetical protein
VWERLLRALGKNPLIFLHGEGFPDGPLEAGCTRNLEKNRHPVPTLESRAISNGLAAPVATSEAPDVEGARMERAATDRAAVAGENPAGARDLGPHFPKTWPPFPKTKVD